MTVKIDEHSHHKCNAKAQNPESVKWVSLIYHAKTELTAEAYGISGKIT